MDNKPYKVRVEKVVETTEANFEQNNSAEMCFETIKAEYDYCMQRAEKLESKVNILLTACAFLFVLLTAVIEKATALSFPTSKDDLAVIVLYVLLLSISIAFFLLLLINLVLLLRSNKVARIDSGALLEKGIPDEKETTAVRYIGSIYAQNSAANNAILEKRYNRFNLCVNMFCCSTIALLLTDVVCIFI